MRLVQLLKITLQQAVELQGLDPTPAHNKKHQNWTESTDQVFLQLIKLFEEIMRVIGPHAASFSSLIGAEG